MKHFKLTRERAIEIATTFVENDFRLLVDSFLSPRYSYMIFDKGLDDDLKRRLELPDRFWIISIIEQIYDYSTTGIWSGNNAPEEVVLMFEDLLELEIGGSAGSFAEAKINELRELDDLLAARESLSSIASYYRASDTIDRSQLALLADMSEESIRQAAYLEGEERLEYCGRGEIHVEEARRWLKVKGKYVKSRCA